MADYPISIDAVREMLIELRRSLGNERYISIGLSMALSQLEGFPQMDAVQIVRCNDCWKRGNENHCPMCFDEYYDCGDYVTRDYTEDDGFCHCGEREKDHEAD